MPLMDHLAHTPAWRRARPLLSAGALLVAGFGIGPALAQQAPMLETRDAARSVGEADPVRTVGPFYRVAPMAPDSPAQSAEDRPLSAVVRHGWRRHSNLYALSPEGRAAQPDLAGADTVMLTGVRLGYDRRISAQRLSLWADVSNNDYRRFDTLDHVAWAAGGLLEWQAGRQWYGTLGVGSQRLLNPFSNQNQTIRNLLELNTLSTSAGFRFGSRWSAFVAADLSSRRNSSDSLRENDLDQTGLEAGVRWQRPGDDADFSLVGRSVRGRYPTAQAVPVGTGTLGSTIDNSYRDRSLLMRLALRPSAPSVIVGEVGVTQRRFDTLAERNFSGLTGAFVWQWQPTDAVRGEAYVRRNFGPIQLANASGVQTWQSGGSLAWRVSAKVTIGLHAGWDRYLYAADPLSAVGLADRRRDQLRVIGVSASWEAWRNILLIADHRREVRRSNVAAASYEADITSVFIQARFD